MVKTTAYELKLFSGNANRPLAEEIAKTLASRWRRGRLALLRRRSVRAYQTRTSRPGHLRDPAHVPAE